MFLDFAKAFDKVPKDQLVSKLQAMGVDGMILGWIKDWLTRQAAVCGFEW